MNELQSLYLEHKGKVSDRWLSYLDHYNNVLGPLRDRAVNLLEIGVQNGGSLELWSRYFSKAKLLVGCDIDPMCGRLAFTDPRISVVVGDSSADLTLQQIDAISPHWDIIIDDGSHQSRHIIDSFARFFPRLVEGGVFIIEDLHCGYWKEFEGGLADPFSSISFLKRISDLVNFEHWGLHLDRTTYLADFAAYYGSRFDEVALTQVHSVSFMNSLCVIQKRSFDENKLGPRLIVGIDEVVTSDSMKYNGSFSLPPDQTLNAWSDRRLFLVPDGEKHAVRFSVMEARAIQALEEVAAQVQKNQVLDAHISQLQSDMDACIRTLSQLTDEKVIERLTVECASADYNAQLSVLMTTVQSRDEQIAALMLAQSSPSARIGRLIERIAKKIFPACSVRRRLLAWGLRSADQIYHHGWFGAFRMRRAGVLDHESTSRAVCRISEKTFALPEEFAAWIQDNEPSDVDLVQQRQSSPLYDPDNPLFSIILPVYKISSDVLLATLQSVQKQTWGNWELCIAYADIENEENWILLERTAVTDARLKIMRLSENRGISGNSNAAFALSRGKYIVLLDHDDELTPWALHDMAQRVTQESDIDFLYSDKDSINSTSTLRQNPLFKPAWSPEMLYSVNYLTHLNVMRRSLVESVCGWNPDTDGAQDWDLFCRVTERSQRIERVPGIHYHWRIIAGSTATGIGAKPYAALSQLRTLEMRVSRLGLPASIQPSSSDSGYRLVWHLEYRPMIDVVLHGGNPKQDVEKMLGMLFAQANGLLASVTLLWEGSKSISFVPTGLYNGIPLRIIQCDPSCSKTELISEGISSGDAPSVVLIDLAVTHFARNSLQDIVGWVLKHPEIGFATALVLLNDDTVVEAGQIVGEDGCTQPLFRGMPLRHWGPLGGPLWYRNVSAASATTIAFKRNLLDLQEYITTPWPQALVSICADVRGGSYRGVVSPHARAYLAQMPTLIRQWHESMRDDPYFHPAFCSVSPLTLDAGKC